MDTSLTLWLQQLSPALDSLMKTLSVIGQEEIFVIVIGLLYWCLDSGLGARLLWLLAFSDFTNGLLKWAFHLPRPYWIDARVKPIGTELSYGLPSGHAQAALVSYGYLAQRLKRRWLWIVAALLILGISTSRLYLGVHFATDVLAGWLVGLIVLIGFARLQSPLTRWIEAKPIGVQIAAALVFSMVSLASMLIVQSAIAGVTDPLEWPVQAGPIDPRNPDTLISDQGLLLGASLGLILMRRTARFDVRGSWRQRGLRLLIGTLGVLIIRFGLGAIFPRDPIETAMIFRYVRYALIALWAIWLAPWMFIRLKLAEPR